MTCGCQPAVRGPLGIRGVRKAGDHCSDLPFQRSLWCFPQQGFRWSRRFKFRCQFHAFRFMLRRSSAWNDFTETVPRVQGAEKRPPYCISLNPGQALCSDQEDMGRCPLISLLHQQLSHENGTRTHLAQETLRRVPQGPLPRPPLHPIPPSAVKRPLFSVPSTSN